MALTEVCVYYRKTIIYLHVDLETLHLKSDIAPRALIKILLGRSLLHLGQSSIYNIKSAFCYVRDVSSKRWIYRASLSIEIKISLTL